MSVSAMSKAARWCRGKEGREHTPVTTTQGRSLGVLGKCRKVGNAWVCVHHVSCEVCRRVLKYEWEMQPEECPCYISSDIG